jgi:hypothetical protein
MVESPIEVQCFTDPATGGYYAVLVNDDFHRAHAAEIRVEAGTTRLVDIIHNKEIKLAEAGFAGGGSSGRLTLAPGQGTILAATFTE